MEAEKQASIRKLLRSWYLANCRRLPWRDLPSLYKTVVSEFMLQQTQVVTVLPYFERWMRAFPNFFALAEAEEALVLKHWEGLGYYSRVRNLHQLSKAIVKQFPNEGSIFQDALSWQTFKGVGEYTSAAITSISFAYPAAVVDGNVIRILARLTADSTVYKGNQAAVKSFTPLANILLDTQDPGTHNQAMMELGATVCFKRKPLCLLCPLKDHCLAFRTQKPEDFPKLQRPQQEKITVRRAYVQNEGKLLFYQNLHHTQRLATLWEFPSLEILGLNLPSDQKPFLEKKRGISHQIIQEHFFYIPLNQALEKALKDKLQLQWLSREGLRRATLSGPHRKWLMVLEEAAKAFK